MRKRYHAWTMVLRPRLMIWMFLATLLSACAHDPVDTLRPRITRVEPKSDASASEPAGTPQPDDHLYPVEGLVGQIAGKPIYAHHVLEGLEEQLASLGRREPLPIFRREAQKLIETRIAALVQDALILDEAERALTQDELTSLRAYVDLRREEILRKYGQGSRALAERTILEETGLTLQENLQQFRQAIIIRTYLQRNLDPLINVTRRDMERYYRDHYDEFNPPSRREVRLIWAIEQRDADWFKEQLDSGIPFDQLAKEPANASTVKGSPMEFVGDGSVFGDPIDEQLAELEAGQWVGPIYVPDRKQPYWFVYIESLDKKPGRTLIDAQVEIERTLRDMQSYELRTEFGIKLRRKAAFTDEKRMTESVLDIAVARYSAQP